MHRVAHLPPPPTQPLTIHIPSRRGVSVTNHEPVPTHYKPPEPSVYLKAPSCCWTSCGFGQMIPTRARDWSFAPSRFTAPKPSVLCPFIPQLSPRQPPSPHSFPRMSPSGWVALLRPGSGYQRMAFPRGDGH